MGNGIIGECETHFSQQFNILDLSTDQLFGLLVMPIIRRIVTMYNPCNYPHSLFNTTNINFPSISQ